MARSSQIRALREDIARAEFIHVKNMRENLDDLDQLRSLQIKEGIESVIRRPIKQSITRTMNAASFVLLILLMLVVTAHDIFKIVG